MGYYTRFELKWDDVLPEPTIAVAVEKWLAEHEEAAYAINKDGSSEEQAKWYDHVDDLKELSKRVPEVLFTLGCVGECGAHWRVVAKGGRSFKLTPTLVYAAVPGICPEERITTER
jgi:hypothetical protein